MPIPPIASWRAIRVVAGAGACDAARLVEGKRMLTKDAPRLPLRDCDRQDSCKCTYKHLADRRGEPRRTIDSGFGIPKVISPEKRRPGERRERKR
jgi:hypothetical protein